MFVRVLESQARTLIPVLPQVTTPQTGGRHVAGDGLTGLSSLQCVETAKRMCATACYIVNDAAISARIPDDDEEVLEEVAALLDEDKSTVVRKALRKRLSDLRIRPT